MKVPGLIFLLLFAGVAVRGQVITGIVKDDEGRPVNNVQVSVIDTLSKRIVAFDFTKPNGLYNIIISPITSDKLAVQVQMLGFKTQSVLFQADRVRYDFNLSEEKISLPQVTVKQPRPSLTIKGDTTSYTISDFSYAQDRVIGDVLKRLPGIEVDVNGRISYNGQPISSFNIEGDDFLGGKYNIGTSSIPNTLVDKVQIIEHYEPIQVLRGTSNSDKTALNITLKDEAKKKPMGKVALGGGLPKLYNGELTNMLFKKPFNAINQFKLNNIGDDFANDLISHIPSSSDNVTVGSILSASSVSYPSLTKSRYLFNNIGLLNTNNSYAINKDFRMRIKFSYLYDKQIQNYEGFTSIFNPLDTINYNESLDNLIKPKKFSSEFTITSNKESHYFNDVLSLDYNSDLDNANLLTNSRVFKQHLRRRFTNYYNLLTATLPVKDKKPITFYSYVSDYKFPEKLDIRPAIYPTSFNLPSTLSYLTQQLSTGTFYTNNYLNLAVPAKISQKYKLGVSWQSQKFISELYGQPFGSNQNIVADSAQNYITWDRYKIYAEPNFNYKTKTGKLAVTFTAPLRFQQTNFRNRFVNKREELSKFYFNPSLNLNVLTGKEANLNLSFKLNSESGNIENSYSGYVLTGYRSLHANNSLNESNNQSVSLTYTFHRSVKLLFFNVNSSYSNQHSNTIPFTQVDNDFSINKTILSSINKYSTFMVSSTISKYLFPLNATLSGKYSWIYSRYNQVFNQTPLPYNNYSHTVSLNFDSKLNRFFNVRYSGLYSHLAGEPARNSFVRQTSNRLSQQADLIWLPKKVAYFKVSAEHLYNPNKNFDKINSLFADATFQYKIDKYKMDMEISLLNIANVKVYNITSLSANSVSLISYPLRGRMALLKVSFNL